MQLPHGAQGFDLVRAVLALLQTLVAHGHLALHAVHAHVLQLVLRARGRLAGARAAADAALRGGDQPVLGEGPARRVAPQAARVAVEDVALLAHHRGLLGALLAQLTLERGRLALLVAVHHPLQDAVPREAAEPPLVQDEAAVALRAGEAGVAGDGGLGSGLLQLQQVVLLLLLLLGRRGLGHRRRENTHPVGGLLARGGGRADEAPVGAVAAVRLAVQAHLVQVQVVVVGHPGAGRSAALRGLRVGGLDEDIPRARQANVVGAWQYDGLPEEGSTHGTLQLFLHFVHGLRLGRRGSP